MASPPRVSFSGEHLAMPAISQHHSDIEASVKDYFSLQNPRSEPRFSGHTPDEIREQLASILEENERTTCLTILACLEAAFRLDYLQRCYRRLRDPLSREFRALYSVKDSRVSLERDIFSSWKRNSDVTASTISELTGAFKYRHWLAHGRYWTPRLGKKYDYQGVYWLAESVFDSFPFFPDQAGQGTRTEESKTHPPVPPPRREEGIHSGRSV